MNKHYDDSWTALNDLNEKMINNNFILTFIKSTESKHKSGENVSEELNALYVLVRNYFDEVESDFSSVWNKIIRNYPSSLIQEDDDLIMPDDVFEELTSETLPESKKSWIRTIDENGIIDLPSEIVERMGFKVGDYLEWLPQDDGESFILKVVNNVSQIMEIPN
jgi:ubiquitin C-terminal hydrolase